MSNDRMSHASPGPSRVVDGIDLLGLECKSIKDLDGVGIERADLNGFDEPIELFRVPGVHYVPSGRVQIAQGCVLEEAINYSDHLQIGISRIRDDEGLEPPNHVEHVEEEVCILSNVCSRTFGHWVEELLKVVMLESNGYGGKYVIDSTTANAYNFESLAMLDVPASRILRVDVPTRFDIGVYTTAVHHFCAHRYPSVFRRLRARLYDSARAESGCGPRVWMHREMQVNNDRGRIVNKEEIDACLKKYGFDSVDYGSLSFADQISTNRNAKALAGIHGSGMVHAGFIPDRGEVVEVFSPHFINLSILQLCRCLDHRYHQIVPYHDAKRCPYPHGEDVMIDVDHLELVLSSLG